jgi:hypothetical protein
MFAAWNIVPPPVAPPPDELLALGEPPLLPHPVTQIDAATDTIATKREPRPIGRL